MSIVKVPIKQIQAISDFYSGNYGYPVSDFGERNGFRMAPYHRLDIGLRISKEFDSGRVRTWEFSVYNVYNRRNPFYYYTENEYDDITGKSKLVLKQVTLFPFMPSISHSQKF